MRTRRPILFSVVVFALGCSPSSGGGSGATFVPINSGPPPSPLAIVALTPGEGQEDVGRNENISITFDRAVDANTVKTSTVTFSSPFGPIAGAYQVAGSVVTFNPTQELPGSSPIWCTVNTGVLGSGGGSLAQDFEWMFRSEDSPQSIASGTGLQQARIAASAGGLVMALWVRDDNGTFRLNARDWQEEAGWGPTSELAATPEAISHLKVLCTEDNAAVAVWTEGAAAPYAFKTARFVAGAGWDGGQTLAANGSTSNLYFTMHREGWGGAGWRTGPTSTGFRYLNADGTWEDEMVPSAGVLNYSLGAGTNGQLFTAYAEYDPIVGYGDYYASRYVPGSGWSSMDVFNGPLGTSYGTAAHPAGMLAYYAKDGDFLLYRFGGTSWTIHGSVLSASGTMTSSHLSTVADGRACLAWSFSTAGGTPDIVGAYLDAGGDVVSVATLEALDSAPGAPIVTCTDDGEAWVFFSQADAAAVSIWRARFVPGTGWTAAEEIDDADVECLEPRASAQGSVGAAAWLRSGAATDVAVRIFKP